MFFPWTAIVGFFIGAAGGSFVNVLVWRMPRGESIVHPPSHCPSCNARLTLPDLFPILSFLLLGAKCRHCKAPVSWRYFWVEVLTGGLWAALWWQYLVVSWNPPLFLAYSLFVTALVAIVFIDLEHFIIPDELNAWLLFVGCGLGVYRLVAGVPGATSNFAGLSLPTFVLSALLGTLIFWGIAFFGRVWLKKDAMGHGDIKMARGIGALLPVPMMLASFGIAVLFGTVIGLIAVAVARSKPEPPAEETEAEEEETQAEPLGLLLVAGLHYVLCLDVLTLLIPPLAKPVERVSVAWVQRMAPGWEPVSQEIEEEEFKPTLTTIPFGPFLALGAAATLLFQRQIQGMISAYLNWATGGG